MPPAGLVFSPQRFQEFLVQQRVSLRNTQIDSGLDSVMDDSAGMLIQQVQCNHSFVTRKLGTPLRRPALIVLKNLRRR